MIPRRKFSRGYRQDFYQDKGNNDKTHLERAKHFLDAGYPTLALTFAKAEFLSRHPIKKYPQYYEDLSGKGEWGGKFEDPEVIAGGEEIIRKI